MSSSSSKSYSSASRAVGRPPAYERSLKAKPSVSLSVFGFLFSEVVKALLEETAAQKREGRGEVEFEALLQQFAHPIGAKALELCAWREKGHKQDLKVVHILQFIHNNVWKSLFGKPADGLEQSYQDDEEQKGGRNDEFRIIDFNVLPDRFISGYSLNTASFVAGIIEGLLIAAEFPAKVTAVHFEDPNNPDRPDSTIFVIKFARSVVDREAR